MKEYQVTAHYEVALFVKHLDEIDPGIPITKTVTVAADDGASAVITAIKNKKIPVALDIPNKDDYSELEPLYWMKFSGEPVIVNNEPKGTVVVQWDQWNAEALLAVEFVSAG